MMNTFSLSVNPVTGWLAQYVGKTSLGFVDCHAVVMLPRRSRPICLDRRLLCERMMKVNTIS